jgi:hypothetical protein
LSAWSPGPACRWSHRPPPSRSNARKSAKPRPWVDRRIDELSPRPREGQERTYITSIMSSRRSARAGT